MGGIYYNVVAIVSHYGDSCATGWAEYSILSTICMSLCEPPSHLATCHLNMGMQVTHVCYLCVMPVQDLIVPYVWLAVHDYPWGTRDGAVPRRIRTSRYFLCRIKLCMNSGRSSRTFQEKGKVSDVSTCSCMLRMPVGQLSPLLPASPVSGVGPTGPSPGSRPERGFPTGSS